MTDIPDTPQDAEDPHIHLIPVPEGWDHEETVAWIDQGLLLPKVDPDRCTFLVLECRMPACTLAYRQELDAIEGLEVLRDVR